ncbi:hypothetical protein M378DRAFT_168720 [Amanita muscaria Koide BX008]|uniref:Uncharacterized protein n=1 Tax=Amanita muscaria (strain Koide BX008) TaxID=946122 RepID=A0A0C2WUE8_AMAMK|nr:hypothetical protein M378DRAFT_168720 [Amanita muscaria Koide BX008]
MPVSSLKLVSRFLAQRSALIPRNARLHENGVLDFVRWARNADEKFLSASNQERRHDLEVHRDSKNHRGVEPSRSLTRKA